MCGSDYKVKTGRKRTLESKYCSYRCNINGNRESIKMDFIYPDRRLYKRLRTIYSLILARCNYKWNHGYADYGARGIRCEWQSFEQFYNDMAPTHQYGLQVDRINNDGNYCKSNCRWATRSQNASNTRRTIRIEFEGKQQAVVDLCRRFNIKPSTVRMRIELGWDINDVFTKPIDTRCHHTK